MKINTICSRRIHLGPFSHFCYFLENEREIISRPKTGRNVSTPIYGPGRPGPRVLAANVAMGRERGYLSGGCAIGEWLRKYLKFKKSDKRSR